MLQRLMRLLGLGSSESSPSREQTEGERPVRLGLAESSWQAQMWVDMLADARIPAMVRYRDPLATGAAGIVSDPAPYTTEVLVPSRYLEEARQVVDDEVFDGDQEEH